MTRRISVLSAAFYTMTRQSGPARDPGRAPRQLDVAPEDWRPVPRGRPKGWSEDRRNLRP